MNMAINLTITNALLMLFQIERFSEFIYDLRQLDESYSEDALVFKKLELCYGKKH